MPEIIIEDFENVELYPPLLDPGVYTVTCEVAPTLEASKSSGNPMLVLKWKVLSGPMQQKADPNGETNPAGRTIYDRISLAFKPRIKQLLHATGLLARDDKSSPMAKGTFNSDILLNTVCQIVLVPDMYNDKPQRKVDRYVS